MAYVCMKTSFLQYYLTMQTIIYFFSIKDSRLLKLKKKNDGGK